MPRDVDPQSTAGRAIFLITRHGSMRTFAIAAALGVEQSVVSTALYQHTKTGRVVVCKVERPGSNHPPENEYRMAAGFRSSIEKDMEQHRPTRRGIVVEPGPLRRTPSDGVTRVPTETTRATPAQTPAPARAAVPITPPTMRQEPAPMPSQPQPSQTHEPKPFRAAMASDGGLFLFLASGGQVELSQDDTRTLMTYLRRILELNGSPTAPIPSADFRLPALLERQVS